MAKAGWVFRLEVATDKPATTTAEMMERIEGLLKHIDGVDEVLVEELHESLKLFEKEPQDPGEVS